MEHIYVALELFIQRIQNLCFNMTEQVSLVVVCLICIQEFLNSNLERTVSRLFLFLPVGAVLQ